MISFSTITDEERRLISQMASDRETGNHLIRERSDKYWELQEEMRSVMETLPHNWDERQKDLYWAYRTSFYPENYKDF